MSDTLEPFDPSQPWAHAPESFKAIVAVGISGSGKSEWAKQFISEQRSNGKKWLMLCRDDFRLDLLRESGLPDDHIPAAAQAWLYLFSNPMEAKVHAKWLGRARWAIEQGYDGVICADTNLDGGRSSTMALKTKLGLAEKSIIRKIFDATADEAIARDGSRPFSVGSDEISKQLHKLGRTLALRKAATMAPKMNAWMQNSANGFQMPKSLLPKPEKTSKP